MNIIELKKKLEDVEEMIREGEAVLKLVNLELDTWYDEKDSILCMCEELGKAIRNDTVTRIIATDKEGIHEEVIQN